MIRDPLLKSASPIAWAVYLGCYTAAKLAREWNISKDCAHAHLARANLSGEIVRLRKGVYGPPRYSTCATHDIDVSINALLGN